MGWSYFVKHLYQLHNVTVREKEVATHFAGNSGTMVGFQGISNLVACFSKPAPLNVHILQ